MIELRLSNQKVAEHASVLFGVPLKAPNAQYIKSSMAEKFEPTYRAILKQITNGSLIHADETKGVVNGGGPLYVGIRESNLGCVCLFRITRGDDSRRITTWVQRGACLRLLRRV
jgi:hypothetical protein